MVFTSDPHKNYLLVQINSSGKKELSRGQQAFISVSIIYGFLLGSLAVCFTKAVQLSIMLTSLFFTWMKSVGSWFKNKTIRKLMF